MNMNYRNNITNSIQEIEKRISGTEDTIEERDSILNTKHPGNLGHHKKAKPKNDRDRRRITAQKPRKFFNKIVEENFSNLQKDISMKVQEAYKTPNRLDKKIPSPYNNQNTKHTE